MRTTIAVLFESVRGRYDGGIQVSEPDAARGEDVVWGVNVDKTFSLTDLRLLDRFCFAFSFTRFLLSITRSSLCLVVC